MALLEAMSRGKIVVANGDCEVLKDHIVNSGSGFFYHSDKDLYQIFNSIINMSKNDINFHSENAKKYAEIDTTSDCMCKVHTKSRSSGKVNPHQAGFLNTPLLGH